MKFLLDLFSDFWLLYFIFLIFILLKITVRAFPVLMNLLKNIRGRDLFLIILLMGIGLMLRIRYSSHINLDAYGWGYIEDALAIKDTLCLRFPARFVLSSAFHIPGYPFLISLALLFVENIRAIFLFNLLFSVLCIGLLYVISYLFTEDSLAGILTAGMLAFSYFHIIWSGHEIPMSVSVFFVCLDFFFFISFLKTKNVFLGWGLLLLFCITINIKFENIVFLPLFLLVSIQKAKSDAVLNSRLKKYIKPAILLGIITLLVIFRFVEHLHSIQSSSINFIHTGRKSIFSPVFFLKNILLLFFQTRGLPFFAIFGLVLLNFYKKVNTDINIVLAWLMVSLLPLFYFAPINAEWQRLQILIPVFLIWGYLISKTFEIFNTPKTTKYILIFFLFCLFALKTCGMLSQERRFSWVDLEKKLKTNSPSDCIITSKILTSKTALQFLFPGERWIFLNEKEFKEKMNHCGGRIYYFRPMPYGLEYGFSWAADRETILNFESSLFKRCNLVRINDLDLFEIKDPCKVLE